MANTIFNQYPDVTFEAVFTAVSKSVAGEYFTFYDVARVLVSKFNMPDSDADYIANIFMDAYGEKLF